MFKSNAIKNLAFSMTLVGAIASAAFADSGASDSASAQQINAANELLRNGEIDQAIEMYGNIAATNENNDELKYNLAVAQYRKSDIAAAASLFNETAGSNNALIAARSRFNLGNCLYATALQTAEQDKLAAIEQLRTAISHFRGSLRSMPDNEDARANIELAAELIRKLEEEQKREEQQQQEDQQQQQDQQNQDQQQQQDQQQDSQDSQSQDSQSDQSQSENQQQDQGQESESDESESEQSKSEQSKSDESQSDEERSNESKQTDSQEEAKASQPQQSQDAVEQQQSEQNSSSPTNQPEQPQQSQNNQSRNAQQPNEYEASLDEQPQDNQPVPTGELTAAEGQDDQEPNGSVVMADPNVKDDGLMTKEEALKMLQAVRDRDMLRRLRQQQRERSRNVPVDRDW